MGPGNREDGWKGAVASTTDHSIGRELLERKRAGPRRRRARRTKKEGGGVEGPEGKRTPEWLEWVKSAAVALVLLVVIRSFLLQTFVITSGSMEDTLLVGDFLMVNRAALGSPVPGTNLRVPGYSEPRRGEVLIFDPAHEDRMKLVKRLVGMPGDTLAMEDKVLSVNGQVQEEAYAKWLDPEGDDRHPWMEWQREHLLPAEDAEAYSPTRDNWGPIVVPEGNYFMLGDNRDFSLDSRYWGLIERWRLEGRALFFYYSYDREAPTPLAFIQEARWGRIGQWIR